MRGGEPFKVHRARDAGFSQDVRHVVVLPCEAAGRLAGQAMGRRETLCSWRYGGSLVGD